MEVFSWNEVERMVSDGERSPFAPSAVMRCHGLFCMRDGERSPFAPSAVTIGGFDGMHLGHDALFSAVLVQMEFP